MNGFATGKHIYIPKQKLQTPAKEPVTSTLKKSQKDVSKVQKEQSNAFNPQEQH